MEKKDGDYYETAATGFGTDLQTRTEKIDLITGSACEVLLPLLGGRQAV